MFESVSSPPRSKRLLGRGAAASLLTHVGAIALGIWATRNAQIPIRREIDVTFVRQRVALPPPPPPAPRQSVRPKATPVKRRPAVRAALVAPKTLPETTPADKAPEEPPQGPTEEVGAEDREVAGVQGGVPGGVAGGVQGGVVGAPPQTGRLEFNDAMIPPSMIKGPSPRYTNEALEHEVQGLMVVKCVVTTEGLVRECRVLQSLPFMDRAVVDALEHRLYTPALLQGRPVEVDYTFRIRLMLPQ
jgi:protein TonB